MSNELIIYGDQWTALKEQATIIAKSGLTPRSLKTPEQVIAAALVAHDLGLSPATVLQGGLYVVNGVVSCNSRLMMALILRSGQILIDIQKGKDWVEVTMKRQSAELSYTARWDEKRVQSSRANIDPKTQEEKWPWRLHRQTMKLWRAIAEAARIVAPDIIGGIYLADEVNVPVTVEEGNLVINHNVIDGEVVEPGPEKSSAISNGKLFSRPMKPADTRYSLRFRSKWVKGEDARYADARRQPDDKQEPPDSRLVQRVAAMMGKALVRPEGGDTDLERHLCLQYLFDVERTGLLTDLEAQATAKWLEAAPDSWMPSGIASEECKLVYYEAMKDAGQQEMDLSEDSDE